MELEFRNIFLKNVQRIGSKTVKKKIAAVIDSGRSAKSLSDLRNLKKIEGSKDYYRIRIGEYRIGIKVQDKTLVFMLSGN